MKLVFAASPLSMQHKGERAKTGWESNANLTKTNYQILSE
jgi:hypothetical protein